ncbi:MAG: diguanylate cyclase [Trueperaceae bacterium]|nr:diguanylate cyclase [Trueperaceae bacterium]
MERITLHQLSAVAQVAPPSLHIVHELNEKAWRSRLSDRHLTRKLSQEAYELSANNQPPYASGIAESLVNLSFLAFLEDHYGEALAKAVEAQTILENSYDRTWLSRVYNVLGTTFSHLGERSKAIDYLYKQINLSQSLNDKENEASGYNNLAIANLNIDADKALTYYHQALSLLRELGNRKSEAVTIHNIAECLINKGMNSEAKPYAQHALKIARELELKHIEISALGLLGKVFVAEKEPGKALTYLETALAAASSYHPKQESIILKCLGDFYLEQNQAPAALGALEKALNLCEASSHKARIYACHESLAKAYEKIASYKQALTHYQKFHQIKEAAFREENEQKVRSLEVLHRTEVAKREAELQKQKNTELQRYVAKLESLNEQVKQLSLRDPLTGVYNRRYLLEHGVKLFSQAQRYNRPLSSIILDVDHFKRVNDSFGHGVGDSVLKELAKLLSHSLRNADILARYGGEEFVILMPETKLENAYLACERLRKTVETHPWQNIHPELRITISIGLAADISLPDYNALIELADSKLYEAKRNGRNRICS